MQAFSDMRRNRTHQTYLTFFGLAGILVLCQIMSSLYPWIPTFVGVVFAYLILEFEHREIKAANIALGFVYLCFLRRQQGFLPLLVRDFIYFSLSFCAFKNSNVDYM